MNAPPDPIALKANIAETLDKAMGILQQLEDSLTHSGFATGAAAYGAMCQILLGQRMWVLANQFDDLEPRFRCVADRARAVHALLAPYTDIMMRLGSMTEALDAALAADGVSEGKVVDFEPAPTFEKPERPITEAVLDSIRAENGSPISFTALKAKLGIATVELRSILNELTSLGAITHKRASGRDVYTLAPVRILP